MLDIIKPSFIAAVLGIFLLGTSMGLAQTQNYVAKFGSTGIANTNSSIFDNGNVGMGTTSPGHSLDVDSSETVGVDATYPLFAAGAPGKGVVLGYNAKADVGEIAGLQTGIAWKGLAINPLGGNVGIGTSTPSGVLDVLAGGGGGGFVVSGANLDPNGSYSLAPLANSAQLLEGWTRSGAGGEIDLISNRGPGVTGGFGFYDYTNSGTANPLVVFQGNGNVGIGTTSPVYPLSVNGVIQSTGGVIFPDGTKQTIAWTGVLCGGDYAESVDVSGDRKHYEPGDVLVIDTSKPGTFLRSSAPYSKLVSGIYSTNPGVVGRRQTGGRSEVEVPMAMIGIVPTKVSAENGPIEIGDLLVSATKTGYAMKGTDSSRMMGAVIGKALGSLEAGTGFIEVLVSLQ